MLVLLWALEVIARQAIEHEWRTLSVDAIIFLNIRVVAEN